MANTIGVSLILSELAITQYDFDPDATTATDIAWVDARDIMGMAFAFFRTVGTSALTILVLGITLADGSGTDVTIKTITPDAAPDAVADQIFFEVTAEEISQAGIATDVDLRGLSLSLAVATGTDEGVVTYIVKPARFKYAGLTSDSVAT